VTSLELLFARTDRPHVGLSASLASMYGGDFGLPRPRVFANFVSSVDGVVALPVGTESGHIVSGNSKADRFVMGLLRACADVVLIGAGTFRKGSGDFWHADRAYPEAAVAFGDLRRQLGVPPQPRLVVVTATGKIDVTQPALHDALVATTPAGEAALRGKLPGAAAVVVLDPKAIFLRSLIERLRADGMSRVLCEGGPSLFGQLVKEGLVDELFLTVSPVLFGRSPGDGRKSLVEGVDFHGQKLELASARRDASHLFLRYVISR
jgi:riboflavin biosynthesis pyrimidine reductase